MKAEDLKKAPKLLAENINLGYTPEFFVMGISSGNQGQVYSLTPGHAKRLLQYLSNEIKNYEEKNGEITAEWNPNVVSPVQKKNPPTHLS
jgi:hypothetical protein